MAQTPKANTHVSYLFEYCRIWGLIKYYHPDVASGKVDMDQVFLELHPQMQQLGNQAEFNAFITGLLQRVSSFASPATPNDIRNILAGKLSTLPGFRTVNNSDKNPIKPDFSWLQTSSLDSTNRLKLFSVLTNFTPKAHQRLRSGFKGAFLEKPYAYDSLKIGAYGLLGIFRLWNAVRYFYPYHAYLSQSWDEALGQVLTDFPSIESQEGYLQAIRKLAAYTQDSHTGVWEEPFEQTQEKEKNDAENTEESDIGYVFPLQLDYIEGHLVVSQIYDSLFANQAGIGRGDCIDQINNHTFKEWQSILHPFISVSRQEHLPYAVTFHLNHWLSDSLVCVVKKNGSPVRFTMKRQLIRTKKDSSSQTDIAWRKIGDVGYIPVYALDKNEERKAFQQLHGCRAMILDMRGYPSPGSADSYSYRFIRRPRKVARIVAPNLFVNEEKAIPGLYQSLRETSYRSFLRCLLYRKYKGKLLVLINQETISAAETECLIIKTNRKDALFIGQNTAAANGAVQTLTLPGDVNVQFAVVGLYYPDDSQFQRLGIHPDISVKPSLDGFRQGKDEVLDRALQYLNQTATE